MNRRLNRAILLTEQQNQSTFDIDSRQIADVLSIINQEDQSVAVSVRKVLSEVEKAVVSVVEAFKNGGRLFYIGAGTSGRLGILDAAECPPTFSVEKTLVQGIIAGGRSALVQSIEGAEDQPQKAIQALRKKNVKEQDVVFGIASSGTTPFVLEALRFGKSIGCKTIFLICNPVPIIPVKVDVLIPVVVGPEVITGSTRMKAGTATKMILNMVTTTAMIQLGKVYGNLMVDLKAVNEKLVDRGTRILSQLTGLGYGQSKKLLFSAKKEVKTALVMYFEKCGYSRANEILEFHNGFVRPVLHRHGKIARIKT